MSSETGIAVRSSVELAQVDELKKILTGETDPPEVVDDPQEISRQMLAEILGAKSDDELEQFGQAVGWRELLGLPIQIKGFSWRPSSFKDGAPVFFVVKGIRMDSGEPVVLTTGSQTVLAQLCNMAERGTLVDSIWALKEADRETARGYRPLQLFRPESIKAAAGKGKAA